MSGSRPGGCGIPGLWVSVVVPTYRRPAMLERCLRALMAQEFDPARYEIVVADDGPDAEVIGMLQRLQRESGGRPLLRYVPVRATQGPAGARNAGWRAAAADIIAFTDDDTIARPSWLRRGVAALSPALVAVAGGVQVPLGPCPTDYERDAAGLQDGEFVTASCFVRRQALLAVGGFDERFTAAWREDSDLHFRLLCRFGEAGIGRSRQALVDHPVRPARWGVSLRQQRKSMFDALLYKKHRRLYRRRIAGRPLWRYYAIVLALLAAALLAAAGETRAALLALAAWLLLTLRFCLLRLRGTAHGPRHVAEMLLTSALIPPLSLYWRAVGALRWRVVFL